MPGSTCTDSAPFSFQLATPAQIHYTDFPSESPHLPAASVLCGDPISKLAPLFSPRMKQPPAPAFLLLLLLFLALGSGTAPAADTSQAAYDDAKALRDAGRYDEAEAAARELTQARGLAFGGADKRTIEAWKLLATIYGRQERSEDLEAQLRALVPAIEQAYGPRHRETLTYRTYLIASMIQHKAAEAVEMCRSLIPIQTRVLGPEDKITLLTRKNYADILWTLNQTEESETQYRQVIPLLKRIYGPEDRDTLMAQNSLGTCLIKLGKDPEAEKIYRSILPACVRFFGAAHVETIKARCHLAGTLLTQKRWTESEPLYREALPLSEQTFGPEGETTLRSLACYIQVLVALNKKTEAEAYCHRLIPAATRVLGPDDPVVHHTRAALDQLQADKK